jgi:endonuclease/exonuclease/phosphatase family metal-dependent hydrolase
MFSTIRKKGTFVNLINVYIPPGRSKENTNLLRATERIVKGLFDKYPKNPVIIAGDFNSYYKDACYKLEFYGYKEIFPQTCTFNRSGN